jgi:hypothetical protein
MNAIRKLVTLNTTFIRNTADRAAAGKDIENAAVALLRSIATWIDEARAELEGKRKTK